MNQLYDDYFSARFEFDPKRKNVWKAICGDIQKRFIPDNSVVLDVGCGYGDFINQIKAQKKIAVDLADSQKYLDKDVVFHQTEVSDLSMIEQDSVDVIFCSNLLEHIPKNEISDVLNSFRGILRETGKLVLIQPNFARAMKHYFDDYTHVAIYTDESLCGLLKAHDFSITCRKAGYLPFSMKSLLPKSYWLTKAFLSLGSPLVAKQMLVVGSASKNV